jgi:hypothetical protein
LKIAGEAKGKDFLNLFCYTGSATVHAALAGAKSTRTFPVALSRDSSLVVVNAMNVWNPGATWVVSCDGRVLNSSYSDSESAAFDGADCKHAEIIVNAIRPDWVQIFEVSAYAEAPGKSR